MSKKLDDYPTVFYGWHMLVLIVLSPIWFPLWVLGLLAKRMGVKP